MASLRSFAEEIINDGYARGRMMKLGQMSHFFGVKGAVRKGFQPNEGIYITDAAILKYLDHPKNKKGGNVPVQYLNLVAKAIQRPKHIYRDKSPRNKDKIIFVGTIPKTKNKVVKAVIHTRYQRNGKIFHHVKSFGIVEKSKMEEGYFEKIK